MKIAFLLAGKSLRMGDLTKDKAKCLIPIGGKPIFEYNLNHFLANNPKELVPVLGYRNEEIINFIKTKATNITISPSYNMDYDTTNNMYSLYQAKDQLYGQEFILCSGDVIYDQRIVDNIFQYEGKSAIMLDQVNAQEVIDSPKTTIENGRITNLGRHLELNSNGGYAIGLYKINSELSTAFFDEIERELSEGNVNMGFHDPLIELFSNFEVLPANTEGHLWAHINDPEDIPNAENIYQKLKATGNISS
jgi:choline kinase